MTCMVGVVDGPRVWIGGDSLGHTGHESFLRGDLDHKVFRRDDMLFGWTGATRFGQVLEYAVEIPEHPEDVTTSEYLVLHLMPALRRAIVEHDGLHINNSSDGWEFLLGYRGGLYSVCHDLSVTPLPKDGAIGCAYMIALGSLHTSAIGVREGAAWMTPEVRVRLALEAAATVDLHVAPPFIIECLEG